ncbi:hypothetical protein ACFL6M_02160 [Candidatus Eisenbacteria bacterium]|uniref:CBM11 domain-containing protein n=1 Tax=Eiseniibacteriota bacterium TaxID=2212470 RepID=A0ABV6YJP0_UNCEI
MSHRLFGILLATLLLAGALPMIPSLLNASMGSARAQTELLVDGDFESNETGKQLRAREEPQGWYESRRDGSEGRLLLKLSTKKVGRNESRKAMIKASPQFNTYLSQRLAAPQEGRLSISWDVYVREILPPYNRSAFQMIGNASVKGRGPNGAGAERFVFLGFENAEKPGKINLFAFEGGPDQEWDTRTLVASDLDLKRWHTIAVDVDVEKQTYSVSIQGVSEAPVQVRAFKSKKKPVPKVLTHVSFASWNDGPGTFYVDNVRTK